MINKFLFSFIAIVMSMVVCGQDIELVNLTVSQKGSKTIYIGIDNKFKIIGFDYLRKIEPVSPIIFTIHEDTITLRPIRMGHFALAFHTKGGKQEIVFDAKIISDVIASIGNLTNTVVDKNDVINQGKIKIHSFKTNESFFENFRVSSFEAHLNNQTFSVQGEKFTDELIAAIRQAKAGDKLALYSIKAKNPEVDKTITIDSTTYELK